MSDYTRKSEQVVEEAKEEMEKGNTATALHRLATFADHGVNNHKTEDLLHSAIDDHFSDEGVDA